LTTDRNFVQSLAKGLSVLQALADAGKPQSLSDIAAAIGQNTTTTTRLCHTLIQLGFLSRDSHRNYHLTPKILALGHAMASSLDWMQVAHNHLEALFNKLNETISLAAIDDAEILYIDRIRRQKYIPFDIQIGSRLLMHCTAAGKVLLACNPKEIAEPIIEKMKFQALTPRTITDLKTMRRALTQIRAQGYATNDEELVIGNRALAAPIFDSQGWSIAALNVAAPTKRYTMEEMVERFVPPLTESAAQLSTDWQSLGNPVTREMIEGGVLPVASKRVGRPNIFKKTERR